MPEFLVSLFVFLKGITPPLIALSFLIFFHELGHFLIARFFGVKVEVFSIGFGKKLLSKTFGGTQYAFSLIPLGGYVKMKGQNDSNPLEVSEDTDSYTSKAPWQRICILLAGPLFNILLAFFIYSFLSFGEKQVLLPVIGEVKADYPASQSGLKSGDRVISINGVEIKTWGEMAEMIATSPTLSLCIQRGSQRITISLVPKEGERKNIFGESKKYYLIGVGAKGEFGKVEFGMWEAIKNGANATYENSLLIFEGIKKLIIGDVPTSEVGGVVSIVQVMHKASESGWISFALLVALISINLGVLNLLPIPALDGGHIIFNLYEMIFRRPPTQNVLYYLTLGGWVILLGLMMLGLYNDIHRILK